MPATQAVTGPGFLLQMSDSAGTTFTTLGRVKDIQGPDEDVDLSDISNMDSPGANGSAGWQEWASSLQKGGTVSFDMVRDLSQPTQGVVSGIQYVKRQGLARNFQVYENPRVNSIVTSFTAFIQKFSTKRPVSGHVELTGITLQITGPVTGPQ